MLPFHRRILPLDSIVSNAPFHCSQSPRPFRPHQTLHSCPSSSLTQLTRHLLCGSSAICYVLLFLYQNVRTMKLLRIVRISFLSLHLAVHTIQHNLNKQKADIIMNTHSCSMPNKMNVYAQFLCVYLFVHMCATML